MVRSKRHQKACSSSLPKADVWSRLFGTDHRGAQTFSCGSTGGSAAARTSIPMFRCFPGFGIPSPSYSELFLSLLSRWRTFTGINAIFPSLINYPSVFFGRLAEYGCELSSTRTLDGRDFGFDPENHFGGHGPAAVRSISAGAGGS